ncbi:hypothetical protein Dsin_000646 [Dipteronia sinensis]|uniref:Uncharacterized protein n=1 Tax=Dipteronia sinensis TaxID=43782 RepID=A0AAE0B3Q6_9ROSI|nr:hypothetical protein Dsin_000646 [Dipteronia sinensis]
MAGPRDDSNATTSHPAEQGPTTEEFLNLQQQINQLCARLEQSGVFVQPNPIIGRQVDQNIRTYQRRNMRNQPAIEQYQQV